MSMGMTFHKFLSGCLRGDRESWRVFLSNYTPLALRLWSLYRPSAVQEQMAFWRDVLLALWANDYERLRGFPLPGFGIQLAVEKRDEGQG
jgi:hypothetical protein